jgi:hypothetical protein
MKNYVMNFFGLRAKAIFVLSSLCFAVAVWTPIHNVWAMSFTAVSVGLMIASLGMVFKKWWISIILLIVMVSPFCFPDKAIDREVLREAYLKELRSFEGVKYVWGGEASSGIDCSGLPRRAYRNALLSEGIKTLNGRMTRLYIKQWFYDSSAKALSESYRSFTKPVHYETTIQNSIDAKLELGDLAVTAGGIHVIIYLGEGYWIQSDPVEGGVIIKHKSEANFWFDDRVSLHRWSNLWI